MAADKKVSQFTAYTSIQNTDIVPIIDIANTTTKKTTWSNIKSVLKTYFDTLYPSGSGTSTGTNTGDQTLPTDATLTITDVTTNNSSTSKHGFLKKLSNTASEYMDGTGAWSVPATSVNASTTVKGIVEAATSGEVTAGTATGGTGAVLAVTPDALAASTPVFNGSGLTNMVAQHRGIFKNGTTTKNCADASTTQTIAHGVGVIPKKVRITAVGDNATNSVTAAFAIAAYNGTTQSSVSFYLNGGGPTGTAQAEFTLCMAVSGTTVGTITFDATNISIAWVKTGSPTGTYIILWEAEA